MAGPSSAEIGRIQEPELNEISGLVASRRHADVYWVHNDSFGAAALFAIRSSGELLARVTVRGASNLDWEDLAAFEQNGRSYLAIGDIGNNLKVDEPLRIYVVPEPALDDQAVEVAWQVRFRFADGPRDTESLAVDVPGQRFLLVDKGNARTGLYALPLRPGVALAERIGEVPHLWPEKKAKTQPLRLSWRATPTAMDLSTDGRKLLLLTYLHLLSFERRPDEDWPSALQRPPRWWRLPDQAGFEAAGWSADGRRALCTREGTDAPVLGWTP